MASLSHWRELRSILSFSLSLYPLSFLSPLHTNRTPLPIQPFTWSLALCKFIHYCSSEAGRETDSSFSFSLCPPFFSRLVKREGETAKFVTHTLTITWSFVRSVHSELSGHRCRRSFKIPARHETELRRQSVCNLLIVTVYEVP